MERVWTWPGRWWSQHCWGCPRNDWTWHSGLGDKVGIGQSLALVFLESFSNLKDSGILFLGCWL